MRHTDFDVSPQRRISTAWLVLSEVGGISRQQREEFLHAMWRGWTKVMLIQLNAELDCIQQKQEDGSKE